MNNLETKQERYNILVSRTLQNKGKITVSLYEIGKDLKEIKENELYLLEFRTFEEFLNEKVNIGRSTAYSAMSFASEYTSSEFIKWGFKKLDLIKRKLTEEEGRKFVAQSPTLDMESLTKQIDRFKGRIGESDTVDETKLKIVRQFNVIESHYNDYTSSGQGIIQEIESWKIIAKRHPDEQINGLLSQSEQMLEGLK